MLDDDYQKYQAGRAFFRDTQEDKYKYGNMNNQSVVGDFDDMPDFAKAAISDHRNKPGSGNNTHGHNNLLTDDEINEIKARRAKLNAKKNKKCGK